MTAIDRNRKSATAILWIGLMTMFALLVTNPAQSYFPPPPGGCPPCYIWDTTIGSCVPDNRTYVKWLSTPPRTGYAVIYGGADVTGKTICIEYTGNNNGTFGFTSQANGDSDTKEIRKVCDNSLVSTSIEADGAWNPNGAITITPTVTGPGVYTVTATWNNTGTSKASDGVITKTATLRLWKVYGIFGPASVTRGGSASYSVTVVGMTPVQYQWVSNHYVPDPGSASWNGMIVAQTTVQCDITLQCPGPPITTFIYTTPILTTACTPRAWSLTPTLAEDNEPDWGDLFSCGNYFDGWERDRITDTDLVFYPNPFSGSWEDGYTVTKVSDGGPDNPLWYVSDKTINIDNETVINKYRKTNGPKPSISAPHNWYVENENTCFAAGANGASCAAWINALYAHENMGLTVGTNGAGSGHYAQVLYDISLPGNDVCAAIEDNVSTAKSSLLSATNAEIQAIEDVVNGDALHQHVKNNWITVGGTDPYSESMWVGGILGAYSGCTCTTPGNKL